jgi:hypothetical protein
VKVTLAPAVEILVEQTDSVFGNPRAPSGLIDPIKKSVRFLERQNSFREEAVPVNSWQFNSDVKS